MRQAIFGGRLPASIRITTTITAAALLAGCQAGPSGGDATRAAPASGSVQLIERDVEAPEVFRVEDRALWDGRPSLGGVWVASPGVRDPERVIIRNTENGKFVIGALFKRERDNPGPALQLSSDAAAALGIFAGAPTTIDVVALRREEVAEPVAAPAANAPSEPAEVELAPLEEEIVEAPAAPMVETPEVAVAAPVAAAPVAAPDVRATEVALAEPEAPRRGNFLSRLFRRNRDNAPAPMPDAALVPVEATPATGAATPEVTATSLDTAPERVASVQAPAGGGLDRAFVQIGIFSVEQNAKDTATALSNAGVVPTVLAQESQGRAFWRVVVGPSTTAGDRAAVIRKAKDLGFNDAFAVGS